jgi:hypothetical protein
MMQAMTDVTVVIFASVCFCSGLGGSLVNTAWRVLRLRMEGRPPVTEGSCEYIE